MDGIEGQLTSLESKIDILDSVLDTVQTNTANIDTNTLASGGSTVAASLISGGVTAAGALVSGGTTLAAAAIGSASGETFADILEEASGTVEDNDITSGNTDMTIRPAADDKAMIKGLTCVNNHGSASTVFTVFYTDGTNEVEVVQSGSIGIGNQYNVIAALTGHPITITRDSYLLVRSSQAADGSGMEIKFAWDGVVGSTTPAVVVPT